MFWLSCGLTRNTLWQMTSDHNDHMNVTFTLGEKKLKETSPEFGVCLEMVWHFP